MGSGRPPVNSYKHARGSDGTRADCWLDLIVFILRRKPQELESIDEVEGSQQISDRELDKISSTMNGQLHTSALTHGHGKEVSPTSRSLHSPIQQPNLAFGYYLQPMIAMDTTTASQQQIGQATLQQVKTEGGFETSVLNTASSASGIPRQVLTYHSPFTPTLFTYADEINIWNGSQQPRGPNQSALHAASMTMAGPSSAFSSQLPLLQQPSQVSTVTTNTQTYLAGSQQIMQLIAESLNEIQLHLQILTSYFAHIRRHSCHGLSNAKNDAVHHWINSAKQWESLVPASWKARLPNPPPNTNIMRATFHRQTRIQILIEAQRRQDWGMRWQVSGEWQHDVNVAAFGEELRLMKMWTQMFYGMLRDLKLNFPLVGDVFQEFGCGGGWSHLLGEDGEANIDGL
jgi:hypothetical protein